MHQRRFDMKVMATAAVLAVAAHGAHGHRAHLRCPFKCL
jgi:hypothetical protein